MTPRLIQISGVIVDHTYQIEAVPNAGGEARVFASYMTAGGGFNAMVAARRSGMTVAYGGSLGAWGNVRAESPVRDVSGVERSQRPFGGPEVPANPALSCRPGMAAITRQPYVKTETGTN